MTVKHSTTVIDNLLIILFMRRKRDANLYFIKYFYDGKTFDHRNR